MEVLNKLGKIRKITVLALMAYGLYRLTFADMYSQADIQDLSLSPEERQSRRVHNKTHVLLTTTQELKDIQLDSAETDPEAKKRARKTAIETNKLFAILIEQHTAGHK